MDCLFCKIVAGEIPNYTVHQDEHVLAFLDIHPCSKGHTVVIPKKHFSNLSEMSAQDWVNVARGLAATHKRVYEVIKPHAINIGANDRPAAGQAVGHVHWHIIPRWEGDGGGSMHSIVRQGSETEVGEVAKMFWQKKRFVL